MHINKCKHILYAFACHYAKMKVSFDSCDIKKRAML